jgi:hypothetical protein
MSVVVAERVVSDTMKYFHQFNTLRRGSNECGDVNPDSEVS